MEQENPPLHGYNGRFLRVDLSGGRISVETPVLEYYQRYLGGRGFIAEILLRELDPGIDPLGPENKLIFALGPLTGMPLAGSGRNSVGAKSPLSGGFGEAEAGGYWGAELKRAGFDAVIVEGASPVPVYLWVDRGEAELRQAEELWGLEVAQAHEALQESLGSKRIRTALIGPGGERLIRFACVLNDVTHAAGRCGLGAVMGSKKLKAVAVRGRAAPSPADPARLKEINRWLAENFRNRAAVWKYGTGGAVEAYSAAGNLPTHNFQEGNFDQAAQISALALCEAHRVGMHGCFVCPIKCKKNIRIQGEYQVDPRYGGAEYETLASFGSNCGVSDLGAISKAHEICNRFGIDTISAGSTVAFAMECFERSILTEQDTGGLTLRFGDGRAMVELLERMARREGLGDILAEGTRRAARKLGPGAEDYAIQVKGVEMAMHDPRLKQGQAINLSVNPAGPDHASSIQDPVLVKGPLFDEWAGIDVNESIPSTELSPRKARLVYQVGLWCHLVNHLGLCVLVPYTRNHIRDAVEAAIGWPMSFWRLMKTAERGLTLAKIFNLREGFSSRDDWLPRRFQTPQTRGGLKGVIVEPDRMEEARGLYYQMLGWDEAGVPTRSRLVELDIDWSARHLSPAA